jgi:glycosyltransferase involved in cell wall biosynthesis
MKIILGMMTHNEENRYLKEILASTDSWVDDYVFVDNDSTDGTVSIIEDFEIKLRQRMKIIKLDKNYFVKDESISRNLLIKECLSAAKYDDWIFILDADEILCNGMILRVMLSEPAIYTSFYSPVYDMWTSRQYRDDVLWQGHNNKFPIGFRKLIGVEYAQLNGELHCGRIPQESYPLGGVCQKNVAIKHLGWSRSEDRISKYDRYMKLDGKGEHGSLKQYESILDPSPNLKVWDSERFGC